MVLIVRETKSIEIKPKRLNYFTPLRYPGGKAKLAPFVKELIEVNSLNDGNYVEPYAGGAGIALELLIQEYVSQIYLNDISRPVYAFWKSILENTEQFVKLIRNSKLSVGTWDKQKRILSHQDDHDNLELGFATFFLNRTNRSGILGGGIIGGRNQTGPWKIDARYNAKELIFRIESIAKFRKQIHLSRMDAEKFLQKNLKVWTPKTLIYLDPPYYTKGKELYYDYYVHKDHERVASLVTKKISAQKWIVSYDNAKPIRELYSGFQYVVYGLNYSARDYRKGKEVMFFEHHMKVPKLTQAMRA